MSLEKTAGYTSGEQFATEVIEALQNSPRGVTKPVPLVFYLYLPSEEAARTCATALQSAGLAADVEPPLEGETKWLCLGKITLVPTREKLQEIGSLLVGLADREKGQLDGWETELSLKKGCFRIVALFCVCLALLLYWLLKR